MTIPPNPLGNQPKDPFGEYKSESIEKEREGNNQAESGEGNRIVLLGALILSFFQKILALITKNTNGSLPAEQEEVARETLQQFRASLEVLGIEDRSQDLDFLHRLSELWQKVFELSLMFPRKSPFSTAFRGLAKEIDTFPKGEVYSLGYYFSEFKKTAGIPIPYKDLIQKLHRDYEENSPDSLLEQWIEKMDNLIQLLGSRD